MDIIELAGQQALWTSLLLGGPLLLVLLLVGLVFSLIQAVMQVQEAALAFVPKMLVLGVALLLGSPAAVGLLRGFAQEVFDMVVAVGGVR